MKYKVNSIYIKHNLIQR